MLHIKVMGYIVGAKILSPSQRKKIFQAALPLAKSSDKYDKNMAILAFSQSKDPRGTPYLERLATDKNSETRKLAQQALKNISSAEKKPA